MAVGVSPQRLREVRFAEQWRGYRTDEVDEFVEQVAETFDHLERRLGEAAERAARAERKLLDRGSDDDVGRALVLAQRTADATVREAETEAARLIAEAEQRAQAVLHEAEEGVARFEAEREARAQAEVRDLVDFRAALESDVARLRTYVERQRKTLADELRAHLAWLESGTHLEVPPGLSDAAGAGVGHGGVSPKRAGVSPERGGGGEGGGDATLAVPGGGDATGDDNAQAVPARAVPAQAVPAEAGPAEAAPADAESPGAVAGGTAVAGPDRVLGADDGAAVHGPFDQVPETPEPSHGDHASDVPLAPEGHEADQRDSEATAPYSSLGAVEDDPFIAELRRAVEDPEPLGPRDEADGWVEDDVYRRPESSPARRRRRRQR